MNEIARLFVSDPDRPMTEVVFNTMCRLIRDGILLPGDRVPSFKKLSDTLGIDTFSINLAYSELQKAGILRSEPRSGTYVASARAVHEVQMTQIFSSAIQNGRERGLSQRDLTKIFTSQLTRHFTHDDRQRDRRVRALDAPVTAPRKKA